jgi:ABC-type dipeptide/oligopeptide/nickel transport system permease component
MFGRIILIRVLQAIPTLLGVATLVFFLLHLVPGDPVDALLGETAMAADREALRAACIWMTPSLRNTAII